MQSRKKTLISIALTFTLIAAGCSLSSTPTPAPEPIPTLEQAPTVAVDVFPTGTFTKADWILELGLDGTYSARDSGESSEQGDYNVTGNQITLMGNACPDVTGTYIWGYNGAALSFKAVSDDCVVRKNVVESNIWIKNP